MCGRYASTRGAADLSALFEAVDDTHGALAADYNVAPTDPVPIVRAAKDQGGRRLVVARWGLLPHWARDPRAGARMINARVETVATSRAFAPSFAHRRCLVPADGWYEWARPAEGGKRPYFMTRRDGAPLAFAGLWTTWGEGLVTFSIVTTTALGELRPVHDRMPLVLPPARWATWLRAPADQRLLSPPPAEYIAELELRPVGPAVGNVRSDGPHLIERIDAPALPRPVDLRLF